MLSLFENIRMNYYRKKGQNLLVRGRINKAYPYLEKALMLEDSPSNIYTFALCLLTMKRYDEAEGYLEKILSAHPGNELASLTLTELYMQKREWEKARELMASLVRLYPANQNYKKYLKRLENPEKRENYIRAKELLNEAQVLLEKKERDRALNLLLKAEKLDPENPYIQNNIGTFYLMLKNEPKKALTYFQRAYQLEPENKKFKENLFRVRKRLA